MADLRARVVPPIGSVVRPLCALRHMRARLDVGNGARWPRFAIVAVLTAHVPTDVTYFRALEMRAGCAACGCLGWVCAVRPSRMRSTGKNQRARRPLAPSPSRFERSRASLDLLQMPTASARSVFPIMWTRCVGVAGTGDAAGAPRRTNMVVGLDSYVLGTRVRLCGSAGRS